MSNIYKHCGKCDTDKPVSEFYKNKARHDGLASRCKTCMAEDQREKHRNMSEEDKEKRRERGRNRRDYYREYEKKYRIKNREKIREWSKDFYWKNRQKELDRGKSYRERKKIEKANNEPRFVFKDVGRACKQCGEFKLYSEFYKHKKGKDGYRSICKSCGYKIYKTWQQSSQGFCTIKPAGEQLFKSCSKCGKVKSVLYFYADSGKRDGYSNWCIGCEKNHYYKNREYYVKLVVENRRKDPMLILKHRMRSMMYFKFKSIGVNKPCSTEEMLGADYKTVKGYIESQFTGGMSWDKLGREIHIDHICPLSIAKDKEHLKRLFHYTNLQPMWASDNLSKSNKFPEGHQLRLL